MVGSFFFLATGVWWWWWWWCELSDLLQLATLSGRSELNILVVVLKKSEDMLFACTQSHERTAASTSTDIYLFFLLDAVYHPNCFAYI